MLRVTVHAIGTVSHARQRVIAALMDLLHLAAVMDSAKVAQSAIQSLLTSSRLRTQMTTARAIGTVSHALQ